MMTLPSVHSVDYFIVSESNITSVSYLCMKTEIKSVFLQILHWVFFFFNFCAFLTFCNFTCTLYTIVIKFAESIIKCNCSHFFLKIVLRPTGISRKSGTLIVKYTCSQKKEWISIAFYFSQNPSIAHNFGTSCTWLDRFRWSFQQMYLSKWALQSNTKLKMSHVRVPTDSPRSHFTIIKQILTALLFRQ